MLGDAGRAGPERPPQLAGRAGRLVADAVPCVRVRRGTPVSADTFKSWLLRVAALSGVVRTFVVIDPTDSPPLCRGGPCKGPGPGTLAGSGLPLRGGPRGPMPCPAAAQAAGPMPERGGSMPTAPLNAAARAASLGRRRLPSLAPLATVQPHPAGPAFGPPSRCGPGGPRAGPGRAQSSRRCYDRDQRGEEQGGGHTPLLPALMIIKKGGYSAWGRGTGSHRFT